MPVNSVLEIKRVDKNKLSLSLNKNNAYLSNDRNRNEDFKENAKPSNSSSACIQQDRALKRPLKSTYFNTLNAAKKLKLANQEIKLKETEIEPELVIFDVDPLDTCAMLNGDHSDNQYGSNGVPARKSPVATLSNLGNTCFLNSVLYTLRYAPRFIHNLHHLVSDLSSVEQKLGSIRLKSSSLGRSGAGLAASTARSWSSKDLLSLPQDSPTPNSKIQIATERLHETYSSLRMAETKCLNSSSDASPEPFAADAFLSALRVVNSTFEGNRQQDAHELLICILNNIRDTCKTLAARSAHLPLHENGDSNGLNRQPSLESDSKPALGLRKSWKKRKELKTTERRPSPTDERPPSPADGDRASSKPGFDFITEDFEGTMITRTTCMECETVNENRQPMSEVCVPVCEEAEWERGEPFRAPATAPEQLRDQNKYWCGVCLRYVEARRVVSYARLPRLLVLQLKRFSGGMQKITRHAPTPLAMPCFCEPCCASARHSHRYILWAVIMHLGQSLTGGHYVAYARDTSFTDFKCDRDNGCDAPSATNTSSSFMRTLFNRPRPQQQTGCSAKDCCVPRQRESGWLACDDELVKPISNEEFEDLLSAEPKMRSAATPYLLFYVRSEVG